MMKNKMIVRCNKCGKVAPIDEERTTNRFIVYKTKEPCECGGRFVLSMSESEDEE